jgi:hypothetical protein
MPGDAANSACYLVTEAALATASGRVTGGARNEDDQSQCGEVRYFASSAERPGSGSPRTTMFGVNSAAHAASRSAKTSPGATRSPGSISSALQRRNSRIANPHHFLPQIISEDDPDELRLDCVKLRVEHEPELGSFLALPVVTRERWAQTTVL